MIPPCYTYMHEHVGRNQHPLVRLVTPEGHGDEIKESVQIPYLLIFVLLWMHISIA